jgi:hypothetical protein
MIERLKNSALAAAPHLLGLGLMITLNGIGRWMGAS